MCICRETAEAYYRFGPDREVTAELASRGLEQIRNFRASASVSSAPSPPAAAITEGKEPEGKEQDAAAASTATVAATAAATAAANAGPGPSHHHITGLSSLSGTRRGMREWWGDNEISFLVSEVEKHKAAVGRPNYAAVLRAGVVAGVWRVERSSRALKSQFHASKSAGKKKQRAR